MLFDLPEATTLPGNDGDMRQMRGKEAIPFRLFDESESLPSDCLLWPVFVEENDDNDGRRRMAWTA